MLKTKKAIIAACYVCAEKLSADKDIFYGIVKENPFHKEAFCPECWVANPDCHATPEEWEHLNAGYKVWPADPDAAFCPTCARYEIFTEFDTPEGLAAHFVTHYPQQPLDPKEFPKSVNEKPTETAKKITAATVNLLIPPECFDQWGNFTGFKKSEEN